MISKTMNGLKIAEKVSKWINLYEESNYTFLKKYKEILWEKLTTNEKVWEWNNAIVLRHPTKKDKVLKIAKEWNVDKLDVDFINQYNFERWLKKLRYEFKDTKKWEILNTFNIPKIEAYQWADWIYEMEKINWLSLKSIVHLDFNKDSLLNLPNNLYDGLSKEELLKFFKANWVWEEELFLLESRWFTDNDIMIFLKEKWLQIYPEWKDWYKEKDKPYVAAFQRTWFLNDFYKKEITPFNDILKNNWYYHNDIHWWNYMIWEDWKRYMIDFWNSEIKQ
jgi:hypothetical protein